MADDIGVYLNLFIALIFFILFLYFVFQTAKKKRSAPQFIVSLFFGSIGGTFAYIDSLGIMPRIETLALQLTFYSIQFVFFFLFIENLRSIKISAVRLSIATVFFVIQMFALWGIVYFTNLGGFGSVVADLWLWADIGYDGLAIYIYLILGFPIFIRMYKYTEEIRPLIMAIALVIVSLGFFIILGNDLTSFFATTPTWLVDILDLGDILPMTGLFLFLLCYITDVDYLYRLPDDNYILMVTYKSGITIHSVQFETQMKEVKIEEHLLSGLISGINMIFKNVLKSEESIQNISSKDATILMQSGKHITAIIVADNVSAILQRALQRYVREFEERFKDELEKETSDVSKFDSAVELLKPIFPFIKIKDASNVE